MIIKRKKGSKYNNKTVVYNGIKFVSKKEGQRYLFLKKAEEDDKISELKTQVKFELIPPIKEEYIEHLKTKDKTKVRTLQLAINYISDFTYVKDGLMVIEDVKASPKVIPSDFKLKEKMFFWRYENRIRRVFKADEEI